LKRRSLTLLAALAIGGLAASGCGSTSDAVRVNDSSISQRDFEDQLDAVYENEALRTILFGQQVAADQLRGEDDPRGSYSQQYVGGMAGAQVQFMLVAELLEEQGLEVTETDHDALVRNIEGQGEQAGLDVTGAFDGLPGGMREQYLDALTSFELLRSEMGDAELETALSEAMGAADVSISSRYGSWDIDQLVVVSPAGPRPAPGADAGPPQPE
jgi:hypothetical protein